MRVLLTGGAGFIGSCFLWKLNTTGIDDIYVVDDLGTSEKWKNLSGKNFKDYIDKNDLFDYLDANNLKGVDTVVHMGACSSTTEKDASYLMRNNYGYSRRLAEWTLKNNKRFIYASSAATYGAGEQGYSDGDELTPRLRPLNMYGYSKQLFDLWVLLNGLAEKFVGLKFFNVYGPNEYHKGDMRSMVHKGYGQLKETGKIRLFKSHRREYADGAQRRDFVYIKDALDVIWYFVEDPGKHGIFNIGQGNAQTWNDLAAALFDALEIPPAIEYFDMPDYIRDKYQYYTEADLNKLRSSGYAGEFMNLKAGVKDYVSYLEKDGYL